MNLKELAFPIRIYWDLTTLPDADTPDYRNICEEIVAMKFFTVNLLDCCVPLSKACIEILERLKNEMISVSLTVSHSALNPEAMKLLSDLKINELLINSASESDIRLTAEHVRQYGNENMLIGASVEINRDNYRSIPAIVSLCLNSDITRLVFPMQRVKEKGDCFYIAREEAKTISQKLSEIDISSMKITIHDPFLWRIFYPEVSFPGGGCQAANSMAYIGPDGSVYPCPSMPISLGNVKETSLKTILSSDSKKELVKNLHQPPEDCIGCDELPGCMGGCSGRVFALTHSLSQRDPACK